MKKLLLTISALAGFALIGTAQDFGFQKGNVILEGSFQSSTVNDRLAGRKESSFNFTPKAGLFLSDRFALGLFLGIGREKLTERVGAVSEEQDKLNAFELGVFGRYYFLEVGSRFKTYTELSTGYGSHTYFYNAIGFNPLESKKRGFGANAGIGANFFLTERVAINFLFANVLSYATFKPTENYGNNQGTSTSTFDTNLNVFDNFFETASFGLTFKF
ncbi:hypothetical protein M8998_07980 [Sphingobacterium sp. lm-10]|uniref:hypothetical protein n=1 Tax=Sphingobacterium sp. lm-10 TaxID=2944904 RepID=UPI002020BD8B|nr:hypothetical protein [Sphingobacterium sp. lm-10]MCL7987874.1 hypothetical protein [Sphingobacterium sp. lm-10]